MNNFEYYTIGKVGLTQIRRRVESPLEYDKITCEMIDRLMEFMKEQVKEEPKTETVDISKYIVEHNQKVQKLENELVEKEARIAELELWIENLQNDNESLLERTYQYELNNEREIENEDIWHLL